MPFGQVVIGPPGSGKTTYCLGVHQLFNQIGRTTIVVNLDPANENIPYECAVNIQNLVCLDEVMATLNLGPNGGMIYCMEYLEKNMDWLHEQLARFDDCYILFDCPGQVELFTHNSSLRRVIDGLSRLSYRLTAVHLVDSHYCTDPCKFVSVLLLSLSTMVQLELPHINVLSKVDLIEVYGQLDFGLEFYTDRLDLSYLVDLLDDGSPFALRNKALNSAICELVTDYSLVVFHTLNISDKKSVLNVLRHVDKSNGYVFGGLEADNATIMGLSAHEWEEELPELNPRAAFAGAHGDSNHDESDEDDEDENEAGA